MSNNQQDIDHKNHRILYRASYILITLILICAGGLGIYLWQHHKVTSLNQQLSLLKIDNANIKNKNSVLTTQLNIANQSIRKLTQTNGFSPGAPCQTQQLALTEEESLGPALSHNGELFSYQNISSTSCTLNGYPGFLALDSSGHVLPDGPIKTGSNYMFNNPGAKLMTLSPNSKAYFAIGWDFSNVISVNSHSGCIKPTLIESTPPGNLYPLLITVNNQQYFCNSELSISALSTLKSLNVST